MPFLSLFSPRIRAWNQYQKQYNYDNTKEVTTFLCHCASFGEYESIAPIIRHIEDTTSYKAVVSFISPSGIKSLKNTAVSMVIKPLDLPWNMKAFLSQINPKFIIVAQNDYWYHFVDQAHKKEIPVYYVNTYIDQNDYWLKALAKSFLAPLRKVHTIFTKDHLSADTMKAHHFKNVVYGGNLRWQQIEHSKSKQKDHSAISQFIQGKPCLVCGSTDAADELLIINCFDQLEDWKLIIAPHDPSSKRIKELQEILGEDAALHSVFGDKEVNRNILIIDKIGMLKELYAYADIAYIGGGFNEGVHNVLEACIFNIPVIGGPNYQKFTETKDMKALGRFFPIQKSDHLAKLIIELYQSKDTFSQSALEEYIQNHKGNMNLISQVILGN